MCVLYRISILEIIRSFI
uniref:Uncharacterized protein n=1 Tax=Anguilla anguilla TaxID=7936 RepID=A0A0E9UJS2_ANGAN